VCSTAVFTAFAPSARASSTNAAALALANVGKSAGYCAVSPTQNSKGGKQFATSCDGHLGTGQGEYWCADFAKWVWGSSGIDNSGLTAAAASFDSYGAAHGTYKTAPAVGEAITFAYTQYGTAHHVGIVVSVYGGTVTLANGDWNGIGSDESYFARTSSVVKLSFSTSQASRGTYIGGGYKMYVSRIVAGA
jgi:hypothetical protein